MAVTIKDVAKQAGVSTATVSKVMNGSYSISQETIDRVKKVMPELDYQSESPGEKFCHAVYKDHCLCNFVGERMQDLPTRICLKWCAGWSMS